MKVKVRKVTPRRVKQRRIKIAAAAVGAALAVAGTTLWGCRNITLRTSEHEAMAERVKTNGYTFVLDTADLPDYGVGREGVLQFYTEGESPVPAWWDPEEPMAAEWTEPELPETWQEVGEIPQDSDEIQPTVQSDSITIQRTDIGCPDYNYETTLYGWDGHCMETWEMDLFSRIAYLEFGISSAECREAGIDAILRLWESEYYSTTMFGTLSAITENGRPVFSTYPGVWEEEYDYDKLARFREECAERFYNGPVWTAPFFRLGHYHDWAVPCYEIDGVFFSTGKGWN